jgi:hypothetical protein
VDAVTVIQPQVEIVAQNIADVAVPAILVGASIFVLRHVWRTVQGFIS